ncbi:MAG: hypothetical protein WKF84_07995 [Pyrinomonadaceae bacterium]
MQANVGANSLARGLSLGSAVADVTSAPSDTAAPAVGAVGFRLARLGGTRTEAQQIAQLARTSGKTPSLWLDL